ncbi:pseudaminic acid biosynthesis-associated methylase [Pelosinus sp. sgz500959]|uniref:pseudaminic acid biosynthesis-associated methylase n=1 Tax=Pelosinus sp. sgz500959 TaxID=3242472 RepID=UPI00366E09AD
MNRFKTEQEQFWAGEFGNQYIKRNNGERLIASNLALFSKILSKTSSVQSIIEFGANIGLNLFALKSLVPNGELHAIEINPTAVMELEKMNLTKIYPQSILDFIPENQYDLAFTKGVLIHINPDCLPQVYDLLYQSSRRYIMIAEYYNPSPVEVSYRGHNGKLFKRDFAGEFIQRFSNLKLVDYGFAYHGDPTFPQDDLTWFLIEKKI